MDGTTIYALGTPTPSRAHPGALSVIRISGPRAADALIFLTERKAFERGHSARDPALPEPRRMTVRTVLDPLSGEKIADKVFARPPPPAPPAAKPAAPAPAGPTKRG